MKAKDKTRQTQEQLAPVSDGDARPDHQEDALNAEKHILDRKPPEKKLTKERGADIDSADDSRDAK